MVQYDDLMRLQKQLADDGKLIEAGWVGLRLVAISPKAGATQLEEMRMAFFAGCAHLFTAMMGVMDPEAEPTGDDMLRMAKIHAELEAFEEAFKLRFGKPQGQG